MKRYTVYYTAENRERGLDVEGRARVLACTAEDARRLIRNCLPWITAEDRVTVKRVEEEEESRRGTEDAAGEDSYLDSEKIRAFNRTLEIFNTALRYIGYCVLGALIGLLLAGEL